MKRFLVGLVLCSGGAWSAPLFPDVARERWAAEEVATLAARGLLEGYPDGTFKGDRSASRWEVAMIVARLLATMERQHASSVTKADLETVRKLAETLREELEALGVRVRALEEGTARLDGRVTELERITFYGSLEARFVSQRFSNDGNPDNDAMRRGGGLPGVPFMDYNSLIGAPGGTTLRPQTHGVVPVVDYRNGRALPSGVGFTSKAILGLKIRVSEEVDAGAEFAAYTSQGNQFVDGYWGLSAPQALNPFLANQSPGADVTGDNRAPWTRMVLDNFWVLHKPSNTRLRLGALDKVETDRFVFAGTGNLGVFGPARFAGTGADLTGEVKLGEKERFRYELLVTTFGDGNVYQGLNYGHVMFGGDVAYQFERGQLKANYFRYYDDLPGSPALAGYDAATNTPFGNAAGWSPVQWVNPPGYFAAQRSAFEQAVTGAAGGVFTPNNFDTRPIAGWNGGADNSLGVKSGAGNFGSQAQATYGLSAHYNLPLGDGDELRFTAEYGHSDYQSNRNSSYSRGGSLFNLEVNPVLGDLDCTLRYFRVDPAYNPVLSPGNLLGLRAVRPFNFVGRGFLFDNGYYPHNREGIQWTGRYSFADKAAQLSWKAGFLHQTETSLYDVRSPAGSLGANTPTNPVLGFSPGFVDTVFYGFAHPLLYGPLSASSFTEGLAPLENPRGRILELGLGFSYQFLDPNLKVSLGYERNTFDRPSGLAASLGGSQNRVRLSTDFFSLGLSWKADEAWTVRCGSDFVRAVGHYDPAGLYNSFAVSRASTDFTNLDTLQSIPFLGFDHQVSKNLTWSSDFRYYLTRDHVGADVFAGTGSAARGFTTHPFSWSGPQLSSEVRLTF